MAVVTTRLLTVVITFVVLAVAIVVAITAMEELAIDMDAIGDL